MLKNFIALFFVLFFVGCISSQTPSTDSNSFNIDAPIENVDVLNNVLENFDSGLDNNIFLKFEPGLCADVPWRKWSDIQNKPLSNKKEEEFLVEFYENRGIKIFEYYRYTKRPLFEVEECDDLEGELFTVKVPERNVQTMLFDGWEPPDDEKNWEDVQYFYLDISPDNKETLYDDGYLLKQIKSHDESFVFSNNQILTVHWSDSTLDVNDTHVVSDSNSYSTKCYVSDLDSFEIGHLINNDFFLQEQTKKNSDNFEGYWLTIHRSSDPLSNLYIVENVPEESILQELLQKTIPLIEQCKESGGLQSVYSNHFVRELED